MSEIDNRALVAVAGVICITLIEVAALFNGINGTYLSLAVGGITTIIGYVYGISQRDKA